ncbi:hypothetical protein UFOVP263_17 [uncultured Caudovirales phage]|uniref:Uncharacterized protein n=1 Tax=uncultured Caudovirales phage TaxID=2100421 RepID=A0A6J5LI26_9CAUD|nr:hypothetical protein UFOVP263_17 [uncultured Caudovirales phage]CAB4242114.1 hypothetical protein UFOVP91_46 [uncultured Caudovirales phage]
MNKMLEKIGIAFYWLAYIFFLGLIAKATFLLLMLGWNLI